ncbi:hypothetical protein N7468_005831 [Penicillium chermesinum]|uniref:Xylanolytic transcriptional activator regulatory domain-containing protein n=1 Tax=Penicillium chermesinum TaxID=63820 RepID=A0A9W9P0K6_9EURO|nr:uncharacterized protein N7468_005831 [Penicillium chermesinum]KAJ5232875.1 hypothetical protein N7468_005831 [Penicillium chermesinum]KAJ6172527.1 hypothetical protein N7470_001594 [Penicillium chermesinum]
MKTCSVTYLLELDESSTDVHRHATRRSSISSSSSSSLPSSAGSLDAIDTVDEDLDRHDQSRATGYRGKNSEVAWMQRLEAESRGFAHDDRSAANMSHHQLPQGDSIADVSYHLDDLNIDDSTVSDEFLLPEKPLADRLLQVYLDKVHPSLPVIRQDLFLEQYRQVFSSSDVNPGKRWLSLLNMVFTIGCRLDSLYRYDHVGHADETIFFHRARRLSTSDDLIYNHDDLQKVQFLTLMAFYFLTESQISRSWKMIGLAARAGIALGLNFRETHDKFDKASHEARVRLWWSIFYLEHLLSAITGRVSCLGDGSCSVSLPLPFDITANESQDNDLSWERSLSTFEVGWTEQSEQIDERPAWVKALPFSGSLYFHYLVDLAIITHKITNQVYNADLVNRGWKLIEDRINFYNRKLGQWLANLPHSLVFDGHHVDMSSSQISLALHYYSACIVINRPCLTRPETHKPTGIRFPRSRFGKDTAKECLRASLALLEFVPDQLDPDWANTVAPSWALLHFMMQATVVLLFCLSIGLASGNLGERDASENSASAAGKPESSDSVLAAAKKALRWLYVLGETEESSRRGFQFCHRCFRRIAEKRGLDTSGLPYQERPSSEQNEGRYRPHLVKAPESGKAVPRAQQPHSGRETYANESQSNLQDPNAGHLERVGDSSFEGVQERHTSPTGEHDSVSLFDPDFYMADFISWPEESDIEGLLLSMMNSNP